MNNRTRCSNNSNSNNNVVSRLEVVVFVVLMLMMLLRSVVVNALYNTCMLIVVANESVCGEVMHNICSSINVMHCFLLLIAVGHVLQQQLFVLDYMIMIEHNIL